MIKTIIFDFGGVLVRDTIDYFEQKHGWNKLPPKDRAKYERAIKTCELGKISYKQLFKITKSIMAPGMSAMDIERWLLRTAKVLPPMTLAKELSKKHQVLVLSNNFRGWHKTMLTAEHKNLHGIPFINSAVIGKRKQDGAAFRYMVSKYKLKPHECLFVDDHTYNTNVAKKMGFKTFLYKNNTQKLKKALKKLGW